MNTISDAITYSAIVAGILVLTRPGSQGPKLFTAVTSGWSHVLQAATGQKLSG